MKKVVSLILVLSLVLASAVPALAAESDSQNLEKAIITVRNIIQVPEDYSDFQYSSTQYKRNGVSVSLWNLNWSLDDGRGGISATVDNNGNLISYYKYDDVKREGLGGVNKESAEKTALAFLNKAKPNKVEGMRIMEGIDNSNTYRHQFHYKLYKDNIGVDYFKVYIEVDKYTGEVVSYYGPEAGTEELELPSSDGAMTLDEGEKAYLEKIGVKLAYHSSYDYKTKKLSVFPAYSLADQGVKAIDAKTGEAVTLYQGYSIYDGGGRGSADSAGNVKEQEVLSKEELDAVENISGLMTKEQAEKQLRSLVPGITADMKVSSVSLTKNYYESDKYLWEIGFDGAYGIINAKTGELISFYVYAEKSREGKGTLSKERAKSQAESFIRQMAPDKFNQSVYFEYPYTVDEDNVIEYNFQYKRLVKGVEFGDNGFSISINKNSGMITQYNCSWYDSVSFPALDNVMSKEDVFDIINKTGSLNLSYKRISEKDVALVYDFENQVSFMVDPFAGGKLGWDGKPYRDASMPAYPDIAGHWSEQIILNLLENGYYLAGERFNPNEKMTQSSFLRYLYSPMQAYYDDEEFYEILIRDNIVKEEEKAPNAELTRQDAAKFAVRYLGQGKSGEHPEIFVNPFKDTVNYEYRGYVAICYGLGIMKGDINGRFNGIKVLTNAEAAATIYNALQVSSYY